ncbi:MAG: hypothetical protein A3E83_03880 [Gammaproteobacteria bacterium RIFCSPHIGHO2_12_FULL_41_20]|nr:MAG: hypothetical protein A3E83_03880 [Gammaproteobacteria bacterium RIFCSPHIGHO2_12_FULL_41_20]
MVYHSKLSKQLLPHRAYIPQNAAGVVSLCDVKDHLPTTYLAISGLVCCVGMAIWCKSQQRGLMAHLDSDHAEQPQNIPTMLNTLLAAMACRSQDVEVTLIYAKDTIPPDRVMKDPFYKSKYTLIQLLQNALSAILSAKQIKVVSEFSIESRALNLKTGELEYYEEVEDASAIRRHEPLDDKEPFSQRQTRLHHPATLRYYSLHHGVPTLLSDHNPIPKPLTASSVAIKGFSFLQHSPAKSKSTRHLPSCQSTQPPIWRY